MILDQDLDKTARLEPHIGLTVINVYSHLTDICFSFVVGCWVYRANV